MAWRGGNGKGQLWPISGQILAAGRPERQIRISHLNHVVLLLQSDLGQTPGQQLVHIVIDPHRHLDELHSVGTRQTLSICRGEERERKMALVSMWMGNRPIIDLPCVDTARERAKSILFAAKMTARLRNKSMSCSMVNICSARVKEDLSTTENTTRNASALSSSSCSSGSGWE